MNYLFVKIYLKVCCHVFHGSLSSNQTFTEITNGTTVIDINTQSLIFFAKKTFTEHKEEV